MEESSTEGRHMYFVDERGLKRRKYASEISTRKPSLVYTESLAHMDATINPPVPRLYSHVSKESPYPTCINPS